VNCLNSRGRRWIEKLSLKIIKSLVAEAIRRAIQRCHNQPLPCPLKGEHLGIAERLRDDRITRVKISDHGNGRRIDNGDRSFAKAVFRLVLFL